MRNSLRAALCALFLTLPASGLPACNVPVFRYALERWPSANFVVSVRASANPTKEEQALIDALRQTPANIDVELAVPPNAANAAPSIAASYPPEHLNGTAAAGSQPPPFWSGPLTAASIRVLVDSPVRREMVHRLLQGDSAVWILLESGRAEADEKAAKLLETSLAKANAEMKFPDPSADDASMSAVAPVPIHFSMLRVPRRAPAEEAFVAMLCGPGAEEARDRGPFAFAVFGRARALPAIGGETLTADIIADAAKFICGACSCEVKEANPGSDLLVLADWDSAIGTPVVKEPPLPPLISLASFATPAAAVAPSPATHPAASRLVLMSGGLALLVLCALAVAGTLILRKR